MALRLPLISVRLNGLLRSAMTVTSPPLPALPGAASALMLPLLVMRWLALRRITPPLSTNPYACSVPVFFTTPPNSWLAA